MSREFGEDNTAGDLRLSGTVVDMLGVPVADADVRLRPGEKTARTDASGAFAFHGLVSRRFWVSARKDDLYAEPAVVRVIPSTEPLVLRVRRGSTFVVHVTADRSRVPGARVTLDDDAIVSTTDADGVARIHGLSPTFHGGWVLADAWAPASIGLFVGTDPGGVTERYVTLRAGARVEGTVLGPDDVPVPDADITLWRVTAGSAGVVLVLVDQLRCLIVVTKVEQARGQDVANPLVVVRIEAEHVAVVFDSLVVLA